MYPTYAGRVLNGELVILENVKLPENANLLITVLDNGIKDTEPETLTSTQKAAKIFLTAIEELQKELTAEDLAALKFL